MSEAVSCGGVVIFRGKVLVLYKNFMNSRDGWVLPKGTVEKGETYEQTAVREVNEEAGAAEQLPCVFDVSARTVATQSLNRQNIEIEVKYSGVLLVYSGDKLQDAVKRANELRKDGINVCMIRKNDNKSESQYIEYAKASQLSDVVYI